MREPAADPTSPDQVVTDSSSSRGNVPHWRLFIEIGALLALLAVGFSTLPVSVPLVAGALAILGGVCLRWISRRRGATQRHSAWIPLVSTGLVAVGAAFWLFASADLAFVLLAYAGVALLGVDVDRLAPLASVHCLAVALLIACASVAG